MSLEIPWADLAQRLDGGLFTDDLHTAIYATDASIYREVPVAVATPRHEADVRALVAFAKSHRLPILPRGAGTSLAGQCTGNGIIVDFSRHFRQILDFDAKNGCITVQPGIIRDELNDFLAPHGWFFGPNTSTANRCVIGGMVGNNSCGTTSIRYADTRAHVRALRTVLADGTVETFGPLSTAELAEKQNEQGQVGAIYRFFDDLLTNQNVKAEVAAQFPKPEIHRRNTGYAIDTLLEMAPYDKTTDRPFNLAKLLCGSEGTLGLTTAITLQLDRLPPPEVQLIAAHFSTLSSALEATVVAMEHALYACELMDKIILDCTLGQRTYEPLRFFVEGDPAAILVLEVRAETKAELSRKVEALTNALTERTSAYSLPIIAAQDASKVWKLRAAGLGLLSNIPGAAKPIAFVEDTAVAVADLPAYIAEFSALMADFGQRSVYYAHAGAGELHLRPVLDLKKEADQKTMAAIGLASAKLVKKYQGALSGEHGDGRVRGPFLPLMVGEFLFDCFREIKAVFDPHGLFNPGKITDVPPITQDLRYVAEQETPEFDTLLDFSKEGGFLAVAEGCNGSGDCRRLPGDNNVMCPSYMATKDEKDTTRARANALREFITYRSDGSRTPLNHPELKEVLDLCISCKGCTSECPSNVDMATLKAEFLYQYHRENGIPLRARAFANIERFNALGAYFPRLNNWFLGNAVTGGLVKKVLGIAPQRQLPALSRQTLTDWFGKRKSRAGHGKRVFFFADEFTNYQDVGVGQAAVELLEGLGYRVEFPAVVSSGRAAISKGLLERARKLAETNVEALDSMLNGEAVLVGAEPSAVLSFRHEYPKLVRPHLREAAERIAPHCLTIEEFLSREWRAGAITADQFSDERKQLLVHGHCHQKALVGVEPMLEALSIPSGFHCTLIPSGCCGMAGSFGYEAEHYEVSQKIGELVLFPAVRAADNDALLVAPGTSCRHQIKDGTARSAVHPVVVLRGALREY